jgi:hypothetical protein
MAKESLGRVSCAACGNDADVRLSKSGFAYVFCDNGCNLQVFTRNKNQHEALIKRVGGAKKEEIAPFVVPLVEPKLIKKVGLLIE